MNNNNILDASYVEHIHITTPSAPAASKNRIYFKSDDNPYCINSSSTEI